MMMLTEAIAVVMMMVEIVVAVAYVMVVDQFYRSRCTAVRDDIQ